MMSAVDDLLDRCALGRLLDDVGIEPGQPLGTPSLIGDGHSNVTMSFERGGRQLVLRRPPRPPYPAKAHDVLREARFLRSLAGTSVPVPCVVLMCEDTSVLGVPFYVMEHLDGLVVTNELPAFLRGNEQALACRLVATLADLHAVDPAAADLADVGRPEGYLERQLRTFSRIWSEVRTREVPRVEEVGRWLESRRPRWSGSAIVHGDYRLGNLMVSRQAPPRVLAVMDWEMATLGDPLADLGYLLATYGDPDEMPNVMTDLSAVTRAPDFPRRHDLMEWYATATGLGLDEIVWYQVLARWKACVFLESSYRRWRNGQTGDAWFATLDEQVPELADAAWASAHAIP
jgi:aminoglycoside phosphotransferase (APT) family kinase protein